MPWHALVLLVVLVGLPLPAGLVAVHRCWLAFARRRGTVSGPGRLTERRWVWIPCAAYAVAFVACALYGWLLEPNWVQVTRTEIVVDRPILGRERFRIVHLSDLHLEGFGRRERAVLRAVREAKPDLIVLTGDYMNDRGAQYDLVRFLSDLEAPYGVLGVGGNWDGKFPVPDLFKSAGPHCTWLADDYRLLSAATGRELLVVGHDYHPTRALDQLLAGASEAPFRIYLHHSPDAVDSCMRARIDLFLCGHTHGGQVRLPWYGAVVTMSRHHKRFEQGLYWLERPWSASPTGTWMYVNRGIGMSGIGPRVRFLARPEVALIDIVAAAP